MSNSSLTLTANVNAQNVAGGGISWTDPQYADEEDGTNFANIIFAGFGTSDWCLCYSFTATATRISVHETITGLGCLINGRTDGVETVRITSCQLTTSALGTPHATASVLDHSKPFKDAFEYYEVGGDGTMWGLTSDEIKTYINAKFKGFRFEVSEEVGSGDTVYIDGMYMILYFDRRPSIRCAVGAGL